VNIGRRPTVDGLNQTVEVHLFDWSGDLYDQTLSISLEGFLRPEQKFDSLDALRHQIQQDCQAAKAMLGVGQPPLKTQC
jgi:riboflavin kinase/FMN adenylyltransferase